MYRRFIRERVVLYCSRKAQLNNYSLSPPQKKKPQPLQFDRIVSIDKYDNLTRAP